MLDQKGQIAGVVEMGVREQNRVDPMRIDREAIPIAQTQCLEALEQAAINSRRSAFSTRYLEPVTVPAPPKRDKPKPTLTSS